VYTFVFECPVEAKTVEKATREVQGILDSGSLWIASRCKYYRGDRMLSDEGAQKRIDQLESAIRKHRSQLLDDRCYLDDAELYAVLNDGVVADTRLPPKETFMSNCSHFWECRQATDSPEEALKLYRYLEHKKEGG
jgi:hypothetical protein